MEQYISKDALVAEIERKYETNLIGAHSAFRNGKIEALREVKDFLDTLEVKEVNFDAAVHGRIDYPFIGHDFPNIYPNYKELKDYCDKNGIKDEDKVKIIIIKDDIL